MCLVFVFEFELDSILAGSVALLSLSFSLLLVFFFLLFDTNHDQTTGEEGVWSVNLASILV